MVELKVLNETENKRDIKWIVITALGLYLLSTLLFFIWMAIDTYFSQGKNTLINTLIFVSVAGGVGATIAAMTAFSGHYAAGNFKISFIWWYIFRPVGGLVIGAVVYLLLISNLLILSTSPTTVGVDTKSVLFYSAISFLAGFAFEQVAIKFDELASTLFAKKPETEGSTKESKDTLLSKGLEYEFTLPKGYVDKNENIHKKGVMRLATAEDEILSLEDPKVQENPANLVLVRLSRVIIKLGDLSTIDPTIIEGLSIPDLAYLQECYKKINGKDILQ